MPKLFYFLLTFAESGLSIFGIRGTYDQPAYTVTRTIAPGVELRAYQQRVVAETDADGSDDGAAFGRLFGYITGANRDGRTIAMTVPVEQAPLRLAMTVPVESGGATPVMRFYIAPAVAAAGAPLPTDSRVRIVTLPAVTMGVIRYTGIASEVARARQTSRLRAALDASGLMTEGAPLYFAYDPPFALPFLRRNEVALSIKGGP